MDASSPLLSGQAAAMRRASFADRVGDTGAAGSATFHLEYSQSLSPSTHQQSNLWQVVFLMYCDVLLWCSALQVKAEHVHEHDKLAGHHLHDTGDDADG
jgi:hypothetical protein